MSWNDWEAAWRRQQPPVGETADLAALKATFEARRRKLAATVLLRNSLEGGTGIAGTAFLVWLSWRHGIAGWPVAISATIFFCITCVFITDLIRSLRARVGPEAPMLAKVEAEIAELEHQRRLMRTWWAWYLVPGLVALALGFVGLARLNYGRSPPGFLVELLTTPLTAAWLFILVASFTFPLIRVCRALRRAMADARLRLDELEKLKRALSPDGEA